MSLALAPSAERAPPTSLAPRYLTASASLSPRSQLDFDELTYFMGVEAFAVLQEMDVNKDQIIQTDEFVRFYEKMVVKLGLETVERTLQVTERIIAASQKKIERAVNKRRTRKTVVPPANADESATEASAPAS